MYIPAVLRFYNGYTMETLLRESFQVFLVLLNDMFKLQAQDNIRQAVVSNLANYDSNEQKRILDGWHQQSKGADDLLNQAKILREVKNG